MMAFATEAVEQREVLQKEARAFLTGRFPSEVVATMADRRPAALDREAWATFAEMGWTSTATPEDAGGAELSLYHEAALFEEFGRALLPVPFFASVVLAQPLLEGTPLSGELVAGEGSFAVAFGGGARANCGAGGIWSLDGRVNNVAELPLADRVLVRAATAEGGALFAVGLGMEGVTTSPFETIDPARPAADLSLANATGELVLEPLDLHERSARLELRSHIALAHEAIGVAARAHDLSVEHAGLREQFGRPIGAFQAISGRIADSYIELELARALALWALRAADTGSADAALAASVAKAASETAAGVCCESAIQVHGGVGCSWEHPLHRFLRRTRWIAAQAPRRDAVYAELTQRLQASGEHGIPVVELFDGPDEARERQAAREWIAANLPTERRGLDLIATSEFEQTRAKWGRRIAATGRLVAHWPQRYGGQDAFIAQSAIFREECVRAHPRIPLGSGGIDLVAPLLLEHGTDEQKERYLAPMRDEEEIWGQGFSEPDAGSDLAALRTRATRRDDGWVINGSKIWTTYGPCSDVFIVLARTDPDQRRHRGITCFVVPAGAEGVEVRPIRNLAGAEELAEVFFDDVVVPHANVIGEIDNGWSVAMATLAFERAIECTEDIGELEFMFDRLLDGFRALNPPPLVVVPAVGRLWARLQAVKLVEYRSLLALKASQVPPPESSIIKLAWSETAQEVTSLAQDLLGAADREEDARSSEFWSAAYLFSRAYTIYSGTSEILRGIIAERVLRLPRSR